MSFKSMESDIAELKKQAQPVVKKKEFKLPWKVKSKSKKMINKGRALVVFLRFNKKLEFNYVKITDGVLALDSPNPDFKYKFYVYELEATYHYKNIPVYVLIS